MLSYQLVAAISGVIATRLLETSPKGWQSSGSYEDRQYKKLLQNIQNDDFAPILELHYKLLAKSLYDIDKEYIVCFEEIDTPTAKEAAEIREINARTDTTYINAGVLSADEVRNTLREDVNSGYNSLEEEIPDSEDFEFGGSETSQSPFYKALDDDWITTENNVHIPIKNNESNKEACQNFFQEKEQTIKDIKKAIQDIIAEKQEEVIVNNVRNDLEKYGGTNNVAFLKETIKGGVNHINDKHTQDIDGVIDALVNAPVTRYVKDRKVFIENDTFKVILSLDYFGEKKTWLLTGYKKDK